MAEPISAQDLVDHAKATTGLEDFGASGWQEGLARLVAAIDARRFAPSISDEIAQSLRASLVARLEVEDWIKRHPESAAGAIEKPLIIMGLPRTSVTALHVGLTADPRWRHLRAWEAQRPVPPPLPNGELQDPRYLEEAALLRDDGGFGGRYHQLAGGPIEDALLQRLNWGAPEQSMPLFDYTSWWRDLDPLPTLRYQARVIRLLQSRQGPVRWMLKSPWYMFYIGELLATFPGARLVMCHAHPAQVIPSLCDLLRLSYERFLPPELVDSAEIGARAVEHWATGTGRSVEYRRHRPDTAIFDLHDADLAADPSGAVERLYDWLGEDAPADVRRAVAERSHAYWAQTSGRTVAPEAYGLDAHGIAAAFQDYIAAFDPRWS